MAQWIHHEGLIQGPITPWVDTLQRSYIPSSKRLSNQFHFTVVQTLRWSQKYTRYKNYGIVNKKILIIFEPFWKLRKMSYIVTKDNDCNQNLLLTFIQSAIYSVSSSLTGQALTLIVFSCSALGYKYLQAAQLFMHTLFNLVNYICVCVCVY